MIGLALSRPMPCREDGPPARAPQRSLTEPNVALQDRALSVVQIRLLGVSRSAGRR